MEEKFFGGRDIPEIHAACVEGDVAAVNAALKAGTDPDERDSMGFTPLHAAALFNRKDVARALVNAGADVNSLSVKPAIDPEEIAQKTGEPLKKVKNSLGLTGVKELSPLILAIAADFRAGGKPRETTKFLFLSGASINFPRDGISAGSFVLICDTSASDDEMIEWLVSHGAKFDDQFKIPGRIEPMRSTFVVLNRFIEEIKAGALKNKLIALKKGHVDLDSAWGFPMGRTLLQQALVQRARPATLEAIVEAGADPNAESAAGMTPLAYAVEMKNEEQIKALVSLGADVDKKTRDGATALMMAVDAPFYDGIRVLLELGADVNAKDPKGKTAKDYAKDEIVADFVDTWERNKNATSDQSRKAMLFVSAIDAGADDLAAELVSGGGIDVGIRFEGSKFPIIEAAKKGMKKTVAALVGAGADVGTRDERRATALHYAADAGNAKTVAVLVAAGADPGAQDKDGMTPFHVAAEFENGLGAPLISALLASPKGKKALQKRTKENGSTALHHACRQVHGESALTLLAAGADPDETDASGQTPLHLAARMGNQKLIAALLEAGADPEAEDGADMSVLRVVSGLGSRKLILDALEKKRLAKT